MHTCVRLDSLPESVRAEALRRGVQRGVRVEIELSVLGPLLARGSNAPQLKPLGMQFAPLRAATFSGIRPRSELEQAAILTICETCDRYFDGKCVKCRVCGGHRRVDDWVKLSSHHCPEKKW